MKYSLTAAAVALVSLVAADDIACPADIKPGGAWCQTEGAASDILYCTNKNVGEAVEHCPGRCNNGYEPGRAYCEYSGWDDDCSDRNPSYPDWCVKDGGPSGVRTCINGRFPVTYFCDGICRSNGGHAVCLPEGYGDKCPDYAREGTSWCDKAAGPSKIRECKNGSFLVTDKCDDICDQHYSKARCLTRIH